MILDDGAVEEARCVGVARIAGQLVQPGEADQLGDLGVGVEAGQDVALLGQRVEHRAVAYALGQP